MKKLILSILFILCLSFQASAWNPMVVLSGGGVATCDTSNIILWWRAEDPTLNGDCTDDGVPYACCSGADAGTCDYNAGADTVWDLSGGAVIGTDAVKYGVNGLDIHNDYDTCMLDTPSATLDDEGRIGFWIYINDFTDDAPIFVVYYNAANYFRLRMDGTDELNVYWEDSDTVRTELTTNNANLALSTWYFIEFAWKTSTDIRKIYLNGTGLTYAAGDGATIASFAAAVTSVYLGDVAGIVSDYYLDNVIISSVSTDNLYTTCKDETEWPG